MRTAWKMTCQHPLNIQADLCGTKVHQGNTSSGDSGHENGSSSPSSSSSPCLTDHVVAEGLEGVPGGGRLVGEVGRWVGVGLGLVEVVHAAEVSPARVPAHLQEEEASL